MASELNVTLPDTIVSALQEAAEREHKSLNEMAGELVMRGLAQKDRDRQWQDLIAYGHQKGTESGLSEEKVVDLVHAHSGVPLTR
jgi:hypothetical protein